MLKFRQKVYLQYIASSISPSAMLSNNLDLPCRALSCQVILLTLQRREFCTQWPKNSRMSARVAVEYPPSYLLHITSCLLVLLLVTTVILLLLYFQVQDYEADRTLTKCQSGKKWPVASREELS